MNRYRVRHVTRYVYEAAVIHAHHICHLCPRQLDSQNMVTHELAIDPVATITRSGTDYFGNRVHLLEVLAEHQMLEVTSASVVEVRDREPPSAPDCIAWDRAAEQLQSDRSLLSAVEFCFDSPMIRLHPTLAAYAEPTFPKGRALIEAVLEFNARIHGEFTYQTAATDVSTPLAQVLREKRGVCQDFAHVAVGCLRSLGLAARYVSGYLETRPPPDSPSLVGAAASHAWASVYVPGFGWLDFAPTNNLLPGRSHVTVAWGRDFGDVSPLKGVVLGGSSHRVEVSVDVERVSGNAPTPAGQA